MKTNRTNTIAAVTLAVLGALGLAGCASPNVGGGDYGYSQVRGEQSVRLGTIESLRKVKIQSQQPGILGALGGGVAGAALGSTIGQGNGNAAASILGALAAGAAGDAAEKMLSSQDGIELTVRLDNGYVIAVTQGADENFRVGDRVQVLGGGGATRVTKLDAGSGLSGVPPTQVPPGRTMPPGQPPASSEGPAIRYFCPDSNGYYPEVPRCASPWMKVVK